MTFKQHSLTLHFEDADEECWEVLKGLSKDQQEFIIKEALKVYLSVHSEGFRPEATKLELDLNLEHDPITKLPSSWSAIDLTTESDYLIDEIGSPSEWKLESLFVSSELKKDISDPLKQLFQIIGEEDDEEVINFLSTSAMTASTILSVEEFLEENDQTEIETKENLGGEAMFYAGTDPLEGLEGHQKDNLVRSSGLSFILQQVIGEEEDEEVLDFFENSRKKAPYS